MPILPQWTDEHQTTIVINYQGHWTWDEFQQAVDEVNTLMSSVNYSVILIHNTLEGANLPPGNILAQGRTAIAGFADNLTLIIVVANSTLIRTFVNIAAGLNPGGRGSIIKTVANMEQAQRVIETTLAKPSH